MRRIDWSSLDAQGQRTALARPAHRVDPTVVDTVRSILDDVRLRGGEALRDWALRLDGHAPRRIVLSEAVVAQARAALPPADIRALRMAADNIRLFHQATRPADSDWIETTSGMRSRRVWRPLGAAGLYVPGGTAPLFSSLLMQALPAQAARVRRCIVTTPPDASGGIHPAMIAAAAEAGLEDLWLIGGAQAIAALTFGVELEGGTIPACDKLFGPGNAYVAEAKTQAAAMAGGPAIDMRAGPSELLVIADAMADPEIAASDLLSQAEHDADAQVLLIAPSWDVINRILAEVEAQLNGLPREAAARRALAEGRAIRVTNLDQACAVSNLYAPEHLALQVSEPEALVQRITAAGAVFVGAWTAETFGDYAAGPSHVLPTDGAARAMSGLTTAAFMTSISVQTASPNGARVLAPITARLARLEGLEAHARAADLRAAGE